jgi:hypothetical protein
VYLLDIPPAPLVPTVGERARLSVDLIRLDPARFDTDEDLAQRAEMTGDPWVSARRKHSALGHKPRSLASMSEPTFSMLISRHTWEAGPKLRLPG